MEFRIVNGLYKDVYGAECDCLITPEIRVRYDYEWISGQKEHQLCFYLGWLFWVGYVRIQWTKKPKYDSVTWS